MNYAKGLKKARERAHLSQRKLAMKAGFDASYITMLESGKRKPSLEALEKISQAVGLPVNLVLLMCAEKDDLRGIEPGRAKDLLERLVSVLKEEDDE